MFETQATNLLGRQVKVGGKVHLVLLPSPELRFDDIKVADQEGRLDRPFLEARSLEAWLNIGALLSGTIEARKIAIVDPILRLDLKADGTGNWSDVGAAAWRCHSPRKTCCSTRSASVGGRIEITKQGLPQFTLTDVVGDASAQSLSGPYKVSASYLFAGRPQELRFSTSEPDAAGLFRIKSSLRDLDRNTTYRLDGGVSRARRQASVSTAPSSCAPRTLRRQRNARRPQPKRRAAGRDRAARQDFDATS